MAMNLTRLSTTAGVDYLLKTVATGDVHTPKKDGGPSTYYTQGGTPPGKWWGQGAKAAQLETDQPIAAEAASRLFKDFVHPTTGKPLGARPRQSGATAGFDLTFTIPKSVSALWAVASADVQDAIVAAHQEAISQTLTHVEDRVLQTRSGRAGVATVATRGMIAGRFDHFDSREGDPHLHSHVVVSNKVQRADDGKWLTVDSRSLHKAAVSVSELHQNLLMDELHRNLGMEFEERKVEGSRAVVPVLAGIPDELSSSFSTRDQQIRTAQAAAEAQWAAENDGQLPTGKALARIHQKVWRSTRKAKAALPTPLAVLRSKWRKQSQDAGFDAEALTASVLGRSTEPDVDTSIANSGSLSADYAALTLEGFATQHAQTVVQQVRSTRSTWTLANLRAETERLTRNVRCRSPQDRRVMVDAVVEAATSVSVELSHNRYQLTPEASQDVRLALRGRSVFDDDHARVFTDTSILDAESYLFNMATSKTGPTVTSQMAQQEIGAASLAQLTERGFAFAADQREAARQVVTDGKALSAIVGPAGTGKSTTMKAVKAVWEAAHGIGTVTGLTTSAQAASVLGGELDAEANTVAKWLYETVGDGARRRTEQLTAHQSVLDAATSTQSAKARARRAIAPLLAHAERWSLHPGQLLIIDEASMSGTHSLAELTRQANTAGAKVLLVGDPAQLDAVDAGGVLGWLERTDNAVALSSVWRFKNDWEKDASLALRAGADGVINTYLANDRLQHGDDETILEDAFLVARQDQSAGHSTILVAATNDVAADLNQRFTLERRATGEVSIDSLTELRHGTTAGVGETILARKVDRKLRDSSGDFIRNGTQLAVTDITDEHIVAVRSDNNATIRLPRDWAQSNAELGYAITAHRAQGTTVDVGHVAIPAQSSMTRELLYVAMTRGRENNTAWVGELDDEARQDNLLPTAEIPTWRDTLTGIIETTGAERTAHEVREQVHNDGHSLSRLLAERGHLLSLAHAEMATTRTEAVTSMLVDHIGGERTANAVASDRFRALAAEFTRLENRSIDAAPFLHQVSGTRELTSANDVARVLLWRLEAWSRVAENEQPAQDIVEQRDSTTSDPRLHTVLEQSGDLIDARVRQLAQRVEAQPWAGSVDIEPTHPLRQQMLTTIAVYRDAYGVHATDPLGPVPSDQDRARTARWRQLRDQLRAVLNPAPSEHQPSSTTQIETSTIDRAMEPAGPSMR